MTFVTGNESDRKSSKCLPVAKRCCYGNRHRGNVVRKVFVLNERKTESHRNLRRRDLCSNFGNFS